MHRLSTRRHGAPLYALLCAALVAALGAAAPRPAAAEDAFPNKVVHIVVPAVPGGSAGAMAQMLAERLRSAWNQGVVVDYKGGAGTVLGTDFVAKSKPDGYTLLLNSSAHTVNPVVYAKLPYDTQRDLLPLVMLSISPKALVVHPATGVNSVEEFMAAAKAHPEQWSFGEATSDSMLSEHWFNQLAGTKIQVVPYKGSGPMMNDLMGGQVQAAWLALSSLQPFIKSGKMKLLGIASKQPSPLFPDARPLAYGPLDEFVTAPWFGLFAVAGTPQPVLDRIASDTLAILKDPEFRKRIEEQGAVPGDEGPRPFTERVNQEIAAWRKVAKEAGIKPE
jgi:tripartite-type tricarboxylate transporter receptor subunit TctC